jgi:hypothetical protein
MRLLVAEEAPLWELTQQVTDYLGSGRTVAHGPWSADDCRQILGRWFECGLVECIAVSWATKVRSDEVVHYEYDADWRTRATERGQYLVLARDDAGALLADPGTWRADGIGAAVMLCESDQAAGLSFDAWFDTLSGLPDDLIHAHALGEDHDGDAHRTSAEPKDVLLAGLWLRAIEQAASEGLTLLCPVNRDAYLAFAWEPIEGSAATSKSVDDIVFFVNRAKVEQGQPFPFGRHRLWCPGCDAEQYLVVTPSPG